MKHKFLIFLTVALCTGILFTACKKSDSKSDSATTDTQIAAQTDDEAMLSTEMDELSSDVSTVLETDATFSGDNSVLTPIICDATIDINKDSDPMTMTLTFNSGNCSAVRVRSGVIVVSMAKNTEWKTQGAAVTVTYQNVKITRASDSKSVTLNGSHVLTNTSGKLLYNLASTGTVTHTVTSTNMSISFDNGAARTWSISKKYTYTYSNGVVLAISGIHTEGDVENIAEWGVTRFGTAFTTVITTPLIYKQECDFRLSDGVVIHGTADYSATVTFGLDATGAVSGCPGESEHYYYKLDWTRKNGNHFSVLLPY
jgi:hypothetical protein